MTEAAPKTPWMLIVATVLAILGLVLGIASALPAMFAVMMFDAPGSENVFWTQLAAYGMLAMPVVTLGACVIAGIAIGVGWAANAKQNVQQARGAMMLACMLLMLPVLNLAVVIAGFVGLQVVCGGSFSCR